MTEFRNKFHAGQVIRHKRFDYRGVVVGVDQPWYHVLVHGAHQTTYVAERNLEPDPSEQPVEHPLLSRYFDKFSDGFYGNSREEN